MEENINTQQNQEEKKKRGGLLPWLLLFASLVGNGILVYMVNEQKQIVIQKEEIIKTVFVEKDNVKADSSMQNKRVNKK